MQRGIKMSYCEDKRQSHERVQMGVSLSESV